MDGNAVLKWWPLLAASALGLIGWGALQSDVSNLKDRVRQLEERPVTQLRAEVPDSANSGRITKGHLCQELIMALTQTNKPDKIKVLTEQIGKMDCYEGVVAAMSMEASYGERQTAQAALSYVRSDVPEKEKR